VTVASSIAAYAERARRAGIAPADQAILWVALSEADSRPMTERQQIQIADRRYTEGNGPFVSRKPKRKPPRAALVSRHAAAEGWRRGTEALAAIPAETYLEILVPESEPNRGRCHCPWPDHEDRNPSASYRDACFYCHTCAEGGGVFQLGSALSGLRDHGDDFGELRKWLARRVLGAAV
jgi:hypothetical protein